ncbi:MAG: hypothetical protein WDW36_000117 [Sanguina aurantia]
MIQGSSVPTGRHIAALPDTTGLSGGCGKCYEVRCRDSTFTDGYGTSISRNSACYDPSKSVVVTITDCCPCYYPSNAFSNKRWCCGDMHHMDLSQEAFSQLADVGLGVIGMEYREVSCDYNPSSTASTSSSSASGASSSSSSASASGSSWNNGNPTPPSRIVNASIK